MILSDILFGFSDILIEYGYWGFFIAAFLSATILPFSSEIILSALLVGGASPMLCVLTGTLGNTLGGITCYWLGRIGKLEWVEKYLKIEKIDLERAQTWTNKWGAFAAFFSFLPFIGDVINVLLGFLRTNFWKVSLFMAIGKFARYFVWMIINYFLINEF